MASSPLPFASIENKFLRLDYLTTTGPRIIGLYARGVEGNLPAETPDIHWPTPCGEYDLHGRHRLWIAPENLFYICPEDGVHVAEEKDKVVLRDPIDASGLEKEISFRLDENRYISHIASYGMVTNRLSLRRGVLRNYDWVAWRFCPSQLRKDWAKSQSRVLGLFANP